VGVWDGFLTTKQVPFHYLPDLHVKPTWLHKPVVHFRTKNVRLRPEMTSRFETVFAQFSFAGRRSSWNYFFRDLCPDFLSCQSVFVYTKAVVNATIHMLMEASSGA